MIALTHMGLSWARELARSVDGIDIIIDGYDRTPIYETVNNTVIVQEASGGEYLTVLNFTLSERVYPASIVKAASDGFTGGIRP